MTASARRISAVALAFVGMAVSTCALPSRSTTCGDGQGVGELFGVLECDLCASRSCCAEATACAADPGCGDLMRCYQGCAGSGDEACFRECRAAASGGFDAERADALLGCVATRCESDACVLPERAATCPAGGQVPDVFGRYACDLCIRRNLCAEASACASSDSCMARIACMAGCVGDELHPACFDVCRDDGLSGAGDATFFQAVAGACRAECGVGTELGCVGRYAWPTTAQQSVEVTFRAVDRLTGAGFSDLELTACASQPGSCSPVSAVPPPVTDQDGLVSVSVPTINPFDAANNYSGFRGYYRWGGNEQVWLQTHVFFMRPEHRDRVADESAPFATRELIEGVFAQIAAQDPAVPLDEGRGFLVGGIYDCHGSAEFFAPDIALEIEGADDQTRVAYLGKSQTLPDYAATATTEAGQFLVVNVPAGTRRIVFRHVPSGQAVATTDVNVFAGEITVLAGWPQTR